MSLLGIPISRYIDIEDSEEVLRAIRFTPPEMPIDMVLHTPGGLVLAAEQIACSLKRHKGKVTVFVPHYAMSGGTLLSLSADEIIMDADAVLGPVDPQLGTAQASFPAVSIIKALEQPNPNRDDEILIMGDMARKAIVQVYDLVHNLLEGAMSPEKSEEIARTLTDGRWTHDYPISFDKAKEMGLPVSDAMPKEIYDLMELYPQSGARRPSVEYIPIPYPSTVPTQRQGDKK
jgi:ClpP class serine protease